MINRPGEPRRPFGWRELFRRRRHRVAFMKGLEELKMLVKTTAVTDENEIGCDDAYEALDQFAEMVDRGEDPSTIMPQVQKHLDMCGGCREEFEALLRILKAR
jgi:hypothetical protein